MKASVTAQSSHINRDILTAPPTADEMGSLCNAANSSGVMVVPHIISSTNFASAGSLKSMN